MISERREPALGELIDECEEFGKSLAGGPFILASP